ncbi:MAG TPA: hypothetical protein VHV56_11795 [Pseudolabrys sp.]|nr:hypothetical protein [Pseudolabrys sp.]
MTGARAIGVPGWPELACCTASIDKVRIVSMQSSSIEPEFGETLSFTAAPSSAPRGGLAGRDALFSVVSTVTA